MVLGSRVASPQKQPLLSKYRYELGSRLRANGLGLLVGIEAVRDLESLDLGDVGLLGVLGGEAFLDLVGPGVVLGLALDSWGKLVSVSDPYVPNMYPERVLRGLSDSDQSRVFGFEKAI